MEGSVPENCFFCYQMIDFKQIHPKSTDSVNKTQIVVMFGKKLLHQRMEVANFLFWHPPAVESSTS
jgi:hypothetical protein